MSILRRERAGADEPGTSAAGAEQRGFRGAFQAALRAIDALRAAEILVSCNTQINRLGMADLPALLELLIARRIRGWQIALTVPMGSAADRPEILLQPYDLAALFPLLAKLARRCEDGDVRLIPGNNVGYFGPYESLLHAGMPVDHAAGCGAGGATIGIEADGTIKGCPSLPTDGWSGGTVKEHALEAIWERAEPLRRLRDDGIEALWGFCGTCYYASVCRGGCTWTADALLGRPGNNPYCHHRVLELEKQGLRERVVRVGEAPGLPFDRATFELVVEAI